MRVSEEVYAELKRTKIELERVTKKEVSFDDAIRVYARANQAHTPVLIVVKKGKNRLSGVGVLDVDIGRILPDVARNINVDFLF